MSMDLKKTLTDATAPLYAVAGAATQAVSDAKDAATQAQTHAIALLQPAALRAQMRALPATASQGPALVRALPATATQQLCALTGELEKRYAQAVDTVRKVAAEPQEMLFGALLAALPRVDDVEVEVEPEPALQKARTTAHKPAADKSAPKPTVVKKAAARKSPTAKRVTKKPSAG